ncbi:hypothetical protein V8D89_002896 [Ganoderma adspersum]
MTSTPLNNDVLLYILSVSPPKTATSMMETCSFLYHEGAKVILQGLIGLHESEEQSLAVLRFVQAEGLSRCSYVRHLHITRVPESVAQLLSDLLPRMTGLDLLSFRGNPEQVFKSYPYLLPIFAGLRSVKTLIFVAGGERCYEMLRTLQSELSFADIFFSTREAPNLSLAAASHPIFMLQRSASSLTELACSWLVAANTERTFSPKVVYPNLHALELCDRFPLNPLPFMKAFPNLDHLHVENSFPAWDPANFGILQFNREANLALQPPSKDGTPFGWKYLRRYSGPLAELWALGLATRRPLVDVLAYSRPECLTITFENHSLTDVLAGGFLAALRSDGASGLSSLAFVIDLISADRNLDIGGVLADLGSALSGLKLYDLLFAVRDISLSEDSAGASPAPMPAATATATATADPVHALPESTTIPSPGLVSTAGSEDDGATPLSSLNLAERTLDAFDVVAFVNELWTSIPTLHNVLIGVERPGSRGGSLRVACVCEDDHPYLHMWGMRSLNRYLEVPGPAPVWREKFAGGVKVWLTL